MAEEVGFEPTHVLSPNRLATDPLQPLGYSSIRWLTRFPF